MLFSAYYSDNHNGLLKVLFIITGEKYYYDEMFVGGTTGDKWVFLFK